MDVEALLEWYERVRRPLPWRATRDPYALLVSEVMLQQTQALRVVPYYERWLERFPVAPALAGAPVRDVLALWSGLGYNRRALALQRRGARGGLRRLAGRSDLAAGGRARTPRRRSSSFAWDAQVAAVDTNVRRVLSRRDGVERTPRELAARAASLLPAGRAATFNQAMMELGATVCRPRAPVCEACPVASGCHGPQPVVRRRSGPAVRFEDTDRWARGRVVAALLAGEEPPVDGRAARARAGRPRARRPRRPRPRRVALIFRESRRALPILSDRGSGSDRTPRLPDRAPRLRPGGGGRAPAPRRRRVRRRTSTRPRRRWPASTSEQVRLILEAAERGAAELRATAGTEASDHVARVQEAADGMLAKLDALESELNRLLTALRTSGERLVEGLAELQAEARRASAQPRVEVVPPEPEQLDTRPPAPTPGRPRADLARRRGRRRPPPTPPALPRTAAPPAADASPAAELAGRRRRRRAADAAGRAAADSPAAPASPAADAARAARRGLRRPPPTPAATPPAPLAARRRRRSPPPDASPAAARRPPTTRRPSPRPAPPTGPRRPTRSSTPGSTLFPEEPPDEPRSRRAADRPQHGAQRQLPRGHPRVPRGALRARRPRSAARRRLRAGGSR